MLPYFIDDAEGEIDEYMEMDGKVVQSDSVDKALEFGFILWIENMEV